MRVKGSEAFAIPQVTFDEDRPRGRQNGQNVSPPGAAETGRMASKTLSHSAWVGRIHIMGSPGGPKRPLFDSKRPFWGAKETMKSVHYLM